MRKVLVVLLLVVAGAASVYMVRRGSGPAASTAASSGPGGTRGRGGAGGPGFPGGFGGGARAPMPVETAPVTRAEVLDQVTIVGSLIGAAFVEVVPKVNGRLQNVFVRLGDRVSHGQRIAKLEDREIREQVKQAEASFEVARATIRQREADLKFTEVNLERSRNLYGRQLLPKQTLDDADARYQAATAQLDLAHAQFAQAQARLEELRISLANTNVVSPVDGFVGKRYLDTGAYVSPNAPVASVVDIHYVRLVANLVEKDLRRVKIGTPASTEVDAFPGETFDGHVARVAPILDPATRTAQMEIEVPNSDFRLKPGMYARVRLTLDRRADALVVPRNALVDLEGKRGVFVAAGQTAKFREVQVGLEDQNRVEVASGLEAGDRVITTGAAALRDGDRILLPGQGPGGPARRPGGEDSSGPRGPRARQPGGGVAPSR